RLERGWDVIESHVHQPDALHRLRRLLRVARSAAGRKQKRQCSDQGGDRHSTAMPPRVLPYATPHPGPPFAAVPSTLRVESSGSKCLELPGRDYEKPEQPTTVPAGGSPGY